MPVQGPSVHGRDYTLSRPWMPQRRVLPSSQPTRHIPLLHPTHRNILSFSSSGFSFLLLPHSTTANSNAQEMPRTSCLESDSSRHQLSIGLQAHSQLIPAEENSTFCPSFPGMEKGKPKAFCCRDPVRGQVGVRLPLRFTRIRLNSSGFPR